jgi:hypothetical protein
VIEMKKLIALTMAASVAISMAAQDKNGGYPITQVPFTKVKWLRTPSGDNG